MGVSAEFIDRHFGQREQAAGASFPRELRIADPPPPRPRSWRKVWRHLRALLADPEQTERVFELMDAFGGEGDERCFQQFISSQLGWQLLDERPDLVAHMADTEALDALPADSLGGRYLAFRRREAFAPDGLVDINHESLPGDADLDPERRWFFDRLTAMHDLWHVVTGYGTDPVGEGALLAFSVAQIGSRPLALITVGAALHSSLSNGCEVQRFMWRAHLRGRRAGNLTTADWERLLPLPTDEACRRLGVAPAQVVHPRGILRGDGQAFIERIAPA